MLLQESVATNTPVKNRNPFVACPELDRRPRILTVDDDPDIRELNTEFLVWSGYDVDTASGGVAAWKALQRNVYDLVITDNQMPDMTGVELLKKLHIHRLRIPAIMATGTLPALETFKEHLFQPVILLKPYALDDLLMLVKNVLLGNRSPRHH